MSAAGGKNEHFVPQFYLRHFALPGTRERAITTFRIGTRTFHPSVSIAGQASQKNFYGDKEVDEYLTEVETKAAPVVARAVKHDVMPAWHSPDHMSLVFFVMMQSRRTSRAVAELNESHDKLLKELFKDHPDCPGDLTGVRINVANAAYINVQTMQQMLPITGDLRHKLLLNRTGVPLITSDNPAALYNQLLERKRVPGGAIGFASKGLQVFIPLSPDHLLVIFDGDVYKVGRHRPTVLVEEITAASDVRALNVLQAAQALDQLYFDGSSTKEVDIRKIAEKASRFRQEALADVRTFVRPPTFAGPRDELLVNSRNAVRTHLELKCVKILPSAEKYDPKGKAVHKRNNPMNQVYEDFLNLRRIAPESTPNNVLHYMKKLLEEGGKLPGEAN